ncbi:MAG: hypothetical protein KAR47_06335, partial [Planctomycetes bacterium]|nr:hypothetical protein [Planctomycetota bacterium]
TVNGWFIMAYGANDDGTFNVSGGTTTVGSHLDIGKAGIGTLDMTGGTINVDEAFGIATDPNSVGTVYLDGGTINAGSLIMTTYAVMDITAGTLILNGDVTSTINGYMGNGWITA